MNAYNLSAFTEISANEMTEIDGGKSVWNVIGDVSGAVCAGGSAYLFAVAAAASGPAGWVAWAGAAAAATWVAFN